MSVQSPTWSEADVNAAWEAVNAGACLLDVRTTTEYASAHIPGAISMPLLDLARGTGNLPDDRAIYVICSTGNRSNLAMSHLSSQGKSKLYVVHGGMRAWVAAGLPFETPKPDAPRGFFSRFKKR